MLHVAWIVGGSVILFVTLACLRQKWFLYRRLRGRSAEERNCVKAALAENAALFEPYDERILVDWVLQELDQRNSAENRMQKGAQSGAFVGGHRDKEGQEIIPRIALEHGSKPHCQFGTTKITP